ncbi:MAG: cyclic nucleotide-binding domain-containing protein [Gammaproteobacteria bacterium]|nr:cyclic nucleotide-binding domain-containing protein [Gammaproteobacteria bacterium]
MTDLPDKSEVLARAELFTRVDDATLGRIAEVAAFRHYEEGDVVYQMGDEAEHVFVLASGRVRFTLGVGNRPGSGGRS